MCVNLITLSFLILLSFLYVSCNVVLAIGSIRRAGLTFDALFLLLVGVIATTVVIANEK